MEILTREDVTFEEISVSVTENENKLDEKESTTNKEKNQVIASGKPRREPIKRPETVEAKVYKLKSRFVKESLYITLSYVEDESGKRPIEIFINSKDLSRLPEYTVLTRLISAIFRNFNSPKFLLEELQSIYDPNGGYFMKGKYIYSFYSEIAMIIERFFIDIGYISEKDDSLENWIESAKKANPDKKIEVNNFKICPNCNQKSLQVDGGCLNCINPECGYSKCS